MYLWAPWRQRFFRVYCCAGSVSLAAFGQRRSKNAVLPRISALPQGICFILHSHMSQGPWQGLMWRNRLWQTCYFSATRNNKTKPAKSKERRKQHHQEAYMESEEATVFMVCMTVILIMDDHIRRLRLRLEEHTARVRRRRIEQRAILLRFMKERRRAERRAERRRQRRRRLSLTY